MSELFIFLFMLLLAYGIGSVVESKHYTYIHKKEKDLLSLPVVTSQEVEYVKDIEDAQLVMGSVVISLDYFKRFLAGLRNFFGGRIKSYETLLDRGRREAILRMKAQAKAQGYSLILNMRFETSSVGQVTQGSKGSIGCFEVMAYGTAVRLKT
jgi:uncharacterized protein YbjQ (UPF0145 family)